MPTSEIVWSKQVQPGVWVAVADSMNILLAVTTPDGKETFASSAISNVDALKSALDLARVEVAVREDSAHATRITRKGGA